MNIFTNKDHVFEELGLESLSTDQKEQMFAKMVDTVIDRIILRIEPSLTNRDKTILEELETHTANKELGVVDFLVTKVSNLDAIAQEEASFYIQELRAQLSELAQALDAQKK